MDLNISDILQQLQDGLITNEEATSMIQAIKTIPSAKKITYKVSDKGAISFYGLRKMPITLYYEELKALEETFNEDDFKKFLELNKGVFSMKAKGGN